MDTWHNSAWKTADLWTLSPMCKNQSNTHRSNCCTDVLVTRQWISLQNDYELWRSKKQFFIVKRETEHVSKWLHFLVHAPNEWFMKPIATTSLISLLTKEFNTSFSRHKSALQLCGLCKECQLQQWCWCWGKCLDNESNTTGHLIFVHHIFHFLCQQHF